MDKKVMIVDDNDGVRITVEIICQSAGFDLSIAEDGEECLSLLAAGFKGVILMDIMMPGMDGWDTIREIVTRGYYDGNLIVMLTGKGEPDEKMEGLQEYVTDYLTKPFGQQQLVDSLNYYTSLLKTAPDGVAP